jgi:DNA-binding beta-propeller fold protein YncE
VLAAVGRKLKVFSYRGEYLHDFPFHGVEGRAVPTTVTADAEGHVYIADSTSGQILVYDSDERLMLRFGTGRGDGRFEAIQAIAVDRQRNIYVAGAVGMPLQVFGPDGNFLRGWGEHNLGPQNFSLPAGVAVDAAGRVIVVDTIRQVVAVFTPEGGFMDRFGGLGFDPGAMAFPTDVASDGERLYVVEREGNRLQILEEKPVTGRRGPVAARPAPASTRDELRRALGDVLKDVR